MKERTFKKANYGPDLYRVKEFVTEKPVEVPDSVKDSSLDDDSNDSQGEEKVKEKKQDRMLLVDEELEEAIDFEIERLK